MGKHDAGTQLRQASQEQVREVLCEVNAHFTQFLGDFADWPEHGLFNLTTIIDFVQEKLAEQDLTTSREAVCVALARERKQLLLARRDHGREDAMRGC